jgi:hypothetical protein
MPASNPYREGQRVGWITDAMRWLTTTEVKVRPRHGAQNAWEYKPGLTFPVWIDRGQVCDALITPLRTMGTSHGSHGKLVRGKSSDPDEVLWADNMGWRKYGEAVLNSLGSIGRKARIQEA